MAVKNRLVALIGEKQAKTNKPVSQADVANAVGLSRQAIHKWTRNEIKTYPADTLDKLCQFFDCQVGDILVYEAERKAKED